MACMLLGLVWHLAHGHQVPAALLPFPPHLSLGIAVTVSSLEHTHSFYSLIDTDHSARGRGPCAITSICKRRGDRDFLVLLRAYKACICLGLCTALCLHAGDHFLVDGRQQITPVFLRYDSLIVLEYGNVFCFENGTLSGVTFGATL